MKVPPLAQEVLEFWFVEYGVDPWFSASDAFDERIRSRFDAAV